MFSRSYKYDTSNERIMKNREFLRSNNVCTSTPLVNDQLQTFFYVVCLIMSWVRSAEAKSIKKIKKYLRN